MQIIFCCIDVNNNKYENKLKSNAEEATLGGIGKITRTQEEV